ncbi:MAG TPA: hypothetical protein VFA94_00520 [Acidimicrobiales bacterium]|nr:hypothetical protein [Acidimicrobiales bacterium]
MPFAFGVSLLVVVVAVGLAHLAVHASRMEHRIGLTVACALAIPLVAISPAASALLVFTAAGTRRLLPTS